MAKPNGARSIKVGDKVGRLNIAGEPYAKLVGAKHRRFRPCVCECGKSVDVQVSHLVSGETRSCGCLQRDRTSETHRTFGRRQNRIYRIWSGMRTRCFNKNEFGYKNYGGRGITICDEWLDFVAFRAWAQSNGYGESLTIERRNVNGNYEPSNCCWIPRNSQPRNRRDTQLLTAFGETKLFADWARDPRCSIGRGGLGARIARGWSPESAISTPSKTITRTPVTPQPSAPPDPPQSSPRPS